MILPSLKIKLRNLHFPLTVFRLAHEEQENCMWSSVTLKCLEEYMSSNVGCFTNELFHYKRPVC